MSVALAPHNGVWQKTVGPDAALSCKEPPQGTYMAITAMQQYQCVSFEELRIQDYEKKNSGGATSGTAQETQSLESVEKMQRCILTALKLEHAAAKQRVEQQGDWEAMELLEREQRKELETLQNVFRWESHFATKTKLAKSSCG